MNIAKRVQEIIVEQLGVDEKEVKPHATFTDDLGADSLGVVELIMALEREFSIQIPYEEAEKLSLFNLQLIIWRILCEKMRKIA